ncbi:MAG: isoprenyl transferase [Candidatus Omnitrophica bacterium]|nr:isoprenyl transferase [Candidatus Omnitrophota bacterium]
MIDRNNLPKHIAIIMDGNGRWAKKRNLPRTAGHKEGINVVSEIVEAASNLGIKVLSLYAFSTENWKRPKAEVDMLMRALSYFLKKDINKLMKNNIQLRIMGDTDRFPDSLKKLLTDVLQKTKNNSGLILNLALNYGARPEMLKAVKNIVNKVEKGELDINKLDDDKFSQFLYTDGLPDPDLLIRTSGEMRISNFMLWQLSYAELYFCKKLWPDFKKDDLEKAIREYQKRERRFGGINAYAPAN